MTNPTFGDLLNEGRTRLEQAAIEDAELEADVLLRHAMGLDSDRAHLIAALRDVAPADVARRYWALVHRRESREPAAYITGRREFYGLDFACSPAALIPRPETELLVDLAIEWLRSAGMPRPLIVDAGTGTGALAVAIAVHAAGARVVAIDVSSAALRLAASNAAHHGVAKRIDVVQGNLLEPLRAKAEVIVANLPYVSAGDWDQLQPEIQRYEPRGALVGGERGTELIEELLAQAPSRMAVRSLLLCEHGDTQGAEVAAAARAAFPDARIETRRDLAGLDRALRVERG